MSDQPTGERLPSQDEHQRFVEAMRAAADYITTNVKGHMVPATDRDVRVVELHLERANNEDIPSAN